MTPPAPDDTGVAVSDPDGDGFVADEDCDEADATIHVGAEERCDGVDADCDGVEDELDAIDVFEGWMDFDGDSYGDPDRPTTSCTDNGLVTNDQDCDDLQHLAWSGAAEVCDLVDNDCNGLVDDDAVDAVDGFADADGDHHGDPNTPMSSCSPWEGMATEPDDCDDRSGRAFVGAVERCDNRDNDCDGLVDVGAVDAPIWYPDADADGHGDEHRPTPWCETLAGYLTVADDCNDADQSAWTGATEVCDGVDNDCDGETDPGDAVGATTYYADADGDGFGDPDTAQDACFAPSGYTGDYTDCDDDNDAQPDALGHCAVPYTTTYGSTMLVINPGTFIMGGDGGDPYNEYTDHSVTLTHTFWLSEHEVTQAEWAAWTAAPEQYPSMFSGDDLPVERITWEDAALYMNALSMAEGLMPCYTPDGTDSRGVAYDCEGYRFPTEAEWEYAAHAGQSTSYAGSNTLDDVAWHYLNGVGTTHDVCTLATNAWGLCDMTGNVWEWTHDWFDPEVGGYADGHAETDPTGAGSGVGRAARGGSWGCIDTEDSLAYRGFHEQADADNTLGFRMARSSLTP